MSEGHHTTGAHLVSYELSLSKVSEDFPVKDESVYVKWMVSWLSQDPFG